MSLSIFKLFCGCGNTEEEKNLEAHSIITQQYSAYELRNVELVSNTKHEQNKQKGYCGLQNVFESQASPKTPPLLLNNPGIILKPTPEIKDAPQFSQKKSQQPLPSRTPHQTTNKKKRKATQKSLSQSRNEEEEEERVLFEGELLKIQPGIGKKGSEEQNKMFLAKWCQLTEHKFRYYKSKIQAYQNPEKPLFSINLQEIAFIEKLPINKSECSLELKLKREFSSHAKTTRLAEHLFELSPAPGNKDIVAGHLIRVPVYPSPEEKASTMSYINAENLYKQQEQPKTSWRRRETDWFELEEKLLFKNNIHSIDGDRTIIDSWYRLILSQQAKIEQNNMSINHEKASMRI